MRKQQLQAAPSGVWTLEQIPGWGILRAAAMAANKPANADPGYAPYCLLHILDASTERTALYENTGTVSSATWTLLDLARARDSQLVASGSSLTVTYAAHNGRTIALAAAAAITLPAMTGSGGRYRFVCAATATAVTITATGAHLFGSIMVNTDSAFAAGTLFTAGAAVSAGSTVITLDGSTRGGNKGDWVVIEDVASSVGAVSGFLNGSGTEATPYS